MPSSELAFQAAGSPLRFWLSVAAVLLAALLAIIVLRAERKLVAPRTSRLLLALRLLAIGVVGVALIEPVVTWITARRRPPRIIVAVDVSDSMATVDDHASRAEKLRWARALHLIGNASTDARLDRWLQALETGAEPVWVDAHEAQNPEEREQLAEVRRRNFEQILADVARLSRRQIAARLLTGAGQPLLAQLEDVGDVELLLLAGKSQPADPARLSQQIEQPSPELDLATSQLVEALAHTTRTAQSPADAVVLLTDGRDSNWGQTLQTAGEFGASALHVYPVVLGSQNVPRDLAILSLDHPDDVFTDEISLVIATLNTSGFEGQAVTITLQRTGAEPQTQTISPTGSQTRVQFPIEGTAQPGPLEFTLRADGPAELRDDNNQQTFVVQVVDDKVHVLLVEGEARWEFRFLDNALARDQRIHVSQVVFEQPYLGLLDQTFFPRDLRQPDSSAAAQASPFLDFDLVIVGDAPPGAISARTWKLLEDFVAQAGGTLVLVAGRRHLPLEFDDETLQRLQPLTDVRPVSIDPPSSAESSSAASDDAGFRLSLSPEGQAERMLQLDEDPAHNASLWDGLPGHYWGLSGRPKPGATVLASAVWPDQPASGAAAQPAPIIVRQAYGLGHVVWLGIDSTWRWRRRVGDEYHHRFWSQLCRWAVELKAATGTSFVKFGPEQSQYEAGQEILLRARWDRQFFQDHPEIEAAVKLFDAAADSTAPLTTLKLAPAEGRPLVYEGRLSGLTPGNYRVELHAPLAGPATPVVARLQVTPRPSAELTNLSADVESLRQLSGVTGGKLFFPDELDQLPAVFSGAGASGNSRQETPLWSHWSVALAFCLLLAGEWTLRKLNGLP